MAKGLDKKLDEQPCSYYLNGVCYLEERYASKVKDYKICDTGKCFLHQLHKRMIGHQTIKNTLLPYNPRDFRQEDSNE